MTVRRARENARFEFIQACLWRWSDTSPNAVERWLATIDAIWQKKFAAIGAAEHKLGLTL